MPVPSQAPPLHLLDEALHPAAHILLAQPAAPDVSGGGIEAKAQGLEGSAHHIPAGEAMNKER